MTIFQDTRATSLVQRARMSWVPLSLVVALHAAALWSLFRNEFGVLAVSLFLVSWIGLNCCFLVVFRRPAIAALFSLTIVELIILLSKFKFDVTWMTISAMDILMVDPDTVAFLLGIFPELKFSAAMAALILVAASGLLWRFDTFRVRRRVSAGSGALCLGGLVLLANFSTGEPWEPFQGVNHVSNFFRTGIVSVSELVIRGFFDADASTPDRLAIADDTCPSAVKRPHIIMILDESAFDASTAKQVNTLPDYEQHFRSFDGKKRALLVETTGGSTWLSEYSALTGTSARSFGRLKFYVTRIAAGRVERGLPNALKRCGYKTTSFYPAHGAFLSARYFQTNIGVDNFVDAKQMGAGEVEPDRFYYDQAARRIANERGGAPLFMFVYTTLNHFPWDKRYRPDLTPDWRETKNPLVADEYLRRQSASARDYSDFKARLKRDFPAESFLIVRFGDHQPNIGPQLLDPLLPESEISRRIAAYDSRYFTTYYVLDTVNFDPIDTQSARDNLEIAHLPLVVQEAAGLPLDPSFAEQKKILQRCDGLFYRCRDGAEARRFNRLLLDAGLIKRL